MRLRGHLLPVLVEARTGSGLGSSRMELLRVRCIIPTIGRLFGTGSQTLSRRYLTMTLSVLGTLDVELWSPF
jgi:hypothetical protein